jgi:hypothetical protein
VEPVFVRCDTPKFTDVNSFRKGLIWLLIATCAEVPSTVRLDAFFCEIPRLFFFAHGYFASQVLMFLDLNGSFSFFPIHQYGC